MAAHQHLAVNTIRFSESKFYMHVSSFISCVINQAQKENYKTSEYVKLDFVSSRSKDA